MGKLEIANAAVVESAIQKEISRSSGSRYDHRLQGVLLVAKGMSYRQVSQLLSGSDRAVQRWVRAFESKGFDGLREGIRNGRPSRLGKSQLEQLGLDLRGSPGEFGLEGNLWDGPLLSEHLRRNYGVALRPRQCQNLYHQLGIRRRYPRLNARGRIGPGGDPRSESPETWLIRGSEPARWKAGPQLRPEIQHRLSRTVTGPAAQTPHSRHQDGGLAGQHQLPPCLGARPVAAT